MALSKLQIKTRKRNFNLYRLSGIVATLRNIALDMEEKEKSEAYRILNKVRYLRDDYKERTHHILTEIKNVETTTNNKPK
jgi:hypothetical protein